jgi:hypothetical protein
MRKLSGESEIFLKLFREEDKLVQNEIILPRLEGRKREKR